jgi:glucose-1-phosphate thymidylyltransferase
LLEKQGGNTSTQVDKYTSRQVTIIKPSFIHPSAEISNSTIGPHASIGANCKIENSTISESILEADCEIQDSVLKRSLIGQQAKVKGRGDGHVSQLNVGDSSEVLLA